MGDLRGLAPATLRDMIVLLVLFIFSFLSLYCSCIYVVISVRQNAVFKQYQYLPGMSRLAVLCVCTERFSGICNESFVEVGQLSEDFLVFAVSRAFFMEVLR